MSSGYVEELDPVAGALGERDKAISELEVMRQVRMPQVRGLDWETWKKLINTAVLLAQAGAVVDLDGVKNLCPEVPIEIVRAVFATQNYARALEMRGVIDEKSTVGLTEKQMLAINTLTNFADTRKIKTKLKEIGVSESEFNTWLRSRNSRFKAMYRRLSENLFDDAQAAVNTTLVQKAVEGDDIRYIKLFNEMSGRWDPATRQQTDVRQVLNGIVEILTSTIKDPDLLREIGGKLQMLMATSGQYGGYQGEVIEEARPERELTSLNLFG